MDRSWPRPVRRCPKLLRKRAPRCTVFVLRWPWFEEELHLGAEEIGLIDRLRCTLAPQLRRPIGGADEQRYGGGRRFDHRGVEVRPGGPA